MSKIDNSKESPGVDYSRTVTLDNNEFNLTEPADRVTNPIKNVVRTQNSNVVRISRTSESMEVDVEIEDEQCGLGNTTNPTTVNYEGIYANPNSLVKIQETEFTPATAQGRIKDEFVSVNGTDISIPKKYQVHLSVPFLRIVAVKTEVGLTETFVVDRQGDQFNDRGTTEFADSDTDTVILEKPMKKELSPTSESVEDKPGSEMSFCELVEIMRSEANKRSPNWDRLSETMTITYEAIRKSVYSKDEVNLDDIRKFPELGHYKMVKEEYGRILYDIKKMRRLEKTLAGFLNSALNEKKQKRRHNRGQRHPLWETALEMWKNSSQEKRYQKVLGMLALCFERAGDAVVTNLCRILETNHSLDDASLPSLLPTPTIVVRKEDFFNASDDCQIYIYVDCERFLLVPNMYEGVLSVFALYYIFNIKYDEKLEKLFGFFDLQNDNI